MQQLIGVAKALRLPRLHVIVSAMVMAGFGLASGPVLAAGFDYALDELRVTGNLEFFDDFEDGSRTAPPTSAVVDWLGTVSIEEGGFLILNSDNGSFPRPDLGQDLDWIEGLVDLSTPIVDGGSGTTTITASFRPDVPEPFSLLWDGGMYEHYGVYLGTEGFNGVEISVHEWVPGVFGVSFFDNRIYNDPTTGGMLGQETVPTSSITGNIVLELVVDHASDSVTPRYSLDGGASFVDGSDWWAPAQAGPVFDTGNEAFVSPFVFGYVPTCIDGIDNDGDGLTDYPDDPGCADADDLSERSPLLPCDDGADNDADGRIDFDPVTHANPGDQYSLPSGSGDPGCFNPSYLTESPQCQDGAHNDGDGKMDYDAGLSANGFADPAGPDSYCVGSPWVNIEALPACGLGTELALVLAPLLWLYQRRRQRI